MPKQAIEMVANRNVTVRSLSGHVIAFKKDTPTRVPATMITECMAVGIVPTDTGGEFVSEERPKTTAPQGMDREEELRNAINLLRERNERSDFTGAGRPDLRALFAILGWRSDKIEVDNLWKKMREEEGLEE